MRLASVRIATAFVVLLASLAYLGISPARAADTAPAPASTDLLVRFRGDIGGSPTISRTVDQALTRAGISRVRGSLGMASIYRLTVEPGRDAAAAAAMLSLDPEVLYAEPDQPVALERGQAHGLPLGVGPGDRWGLERVRVPEAWPLAGAADVTVAVLDTGVSPTHPDLAGRVLPGWNVLTERADTADDAGHGTFVAGIIAAGQDLGVAPNVRILPVKILDANQVGSTANFVAGISYAVRAGARVVNISAGGVVPSRALADAIAEAEARGVLVVASAGNDGTSQPTYPAAFSTVLAVGASDRADQVAPFSSTGAYVDLAAPGVDVVSTWWSGASGNGYATASGTSAAVPFVSGAAALVLGLDPGLTPAQVRQVLTEAALDIEAPGLDARSGAGRLDAYLAVLLARPAQPSLGTIAELSRRDLGGQERLVLSAAGFLPGERVSLWTSDGSGRSVVRGIAANLIGSVEAELGPVYWYPEGTVRAFVVGETSGQFASTALTITAQAAHPAFAPVAPFESSADRRYFPETGHALAFGFKRYWEANGGLAVFGYPISEEFSELNPDTGQVYTVQYFERNRFEYHPEHAGTPWEVSLGRLGAQLASQSYPTVSGGNGLSDARYLPETGHTLSGPFRAYWESRGGLQLFGYPISEPVERGGRLVQYFERNRFELHPDLPPEHQVLLARFGVDLARQNGYLR